MLVLMRNVSFGFDFFLTLGLAGGLFGGDYRTFRGYSLAGGTNSLGWAWVACRLVAHFLFSLSFLPSAMPPHH